MSSLLVANDVNQLQVLPGEQQAVEVVQVDVSALVILQSFQQSGNNRPLLLNSGHMKRKSFIYFQLILHVAGLGLPLVTVKSFFDSAEVSHLWSRFHVLKTILLSWLL